MYFYLLLEWPIAMLCCSSGHGQQELTFYLPLTALERERIGIAADYVLQKGPFML
jgi:hypothetical protein